MAERAELRARRRGHARFAVAAVALGSVHLALVQYFVPLRAIFSDRPIHGVDFDLHIGQVYRVVEGLRGWGKSWVYDVRLLAGQPEGTITDAGNKGWELWAYLWSSCGAPLPVAFNTWVLLAMLACPLAIFGAARCFELSRGASLTAAAMASALWFFDSFLHWVWFVGMVSWALASCLAALTLGLFYRFLQRRSLAAGVACGVGLGLGHLIHPYTFFALVAPMFALYVRELRRLPVRLHLVVAGMGAFTLAVNAYWLAVAARHWHYILDSGFYAQGKPSYLAYDFLGVLRAGADTGVIGVRSGFRFGSVALALAGLYGLRRDRDARTLPLAVGVLGLFGFAYLGASLEIFSQMQPYRTLVPACLLSTIPAAWFLASCAAELRARSLGLRPALLLSAAGLVVAQHLVQDVLYFVPRALPETELFPDGSTSPLHKYGFLTRRDAPSHVTYALPHDAYIEPAYEECIRWLEGHVHAGARLLVQNGVLGERIAWRTSFEVVGGFFERNVAHAYANYFRRYPEPPTQAELAAYLATYSIDYVVSEPREEFARSPSLRLVQSVGPHRIYRNVRPNGKLLEGSGIVRAQTNRIDVLDTDPSQPLVLSYHYHEALRCLPSCTLERHTRSMDRVGLIAIPAPHPRAFRIVNAYE